MCCVLYQAEGLLVLILYAQQDQPFEQPWREEFLANLSRLLNSIPVVKSVTVLTPEDVESMNLQPPPTRQQM